MAHNVIPNSCKIDWEFRPVNRDDKSWVRARIAAFEETVLAPAMRRVHAAAGVETEIVGDVDGLEPQTDSAAVALAQALTGENATGTVPFGTEAGLFQAPGISAVVCGPGSIAEAHKPDEFVEIAQLGACLDMLGALRARMVR